MDYDPKRSFLEQLKELWRSVPRPSSIQRSAERVRASHNIEDVKNAFFLFNSFRSESCYYSSGLWDCLQCCDCLTMYACSWCYNCVHCLECERLRFSEHCVRTVDSAFCFNCTDCSHCLFCANLEGGQYCIFNQPVSKEEYEKQLLGLELTARPKLELAKERFEEFLSKQPTPAMVSSECQDVSGNYLHHCKGITESFECIYSEQLLFCSGLHSSSRCVSAFSGKVEESAQVLSCFGSHLTHCIDCWGDCRNLTYCSHCIDCSDLLGCVGLKGRQYCILNRQYSKADYERLVAQIKKDMMERDSWGQFYAPVFSGYPYNLSAAFDVMPLNQVQASMMRFPWEEVDDVVRPSQLSGKNAPGERFSEIPLNLDIPVEPGALYLCELSGKPFQLTAEEMEFYHQMQVAPPARSFEIRSKVRASRLAPKYLRLRKSDCSEQYMLTAFPESWKQPVYSLSDWKEKVASSKRGEGV